MSRISVDVAIVGCGVIGLAAAERLVGHGLSVVAVDEAGIGRGASGTSAGLVRAFDPSSGPTAGWAIEGLEHYLRRGRLGNWPAVREDGALTLVGRAGLADARDAVAALQAAGHKAELLGADEIAARFPALAVFKDLAGVYEPRAGWLPAAQTVAAMLRDAGPGLRVLRTRAVAVLVADRRVQGVETSSGTVRAGAVLLAAGVGTSTLAASAGVRLPLRTRAIGYTLFELASGAVPTPLPTVVDATTGAWLRRWDGGGPGTVMAGLPSDRTGVPEQVRPSADPAETERVRGVLRDRFPALIDARPVGGLTAYDAMADGPGAVIALPTPRGLVTATGWNGGGFRIAPAVAARAVDRILELLA